MDHCENVDLTLKEIEAFQLLLSSALMAMLSLNDRKEGKEKRGRGGVWPPSPTTPAAERAAAKVGDLAGNSLATRVPFTALLSRTAGLQFFFPVLHVKKNQNPSLLHSHGCAFCGWEADIPTIDHPLPSIKAQSAFAAGAGVDTQGKRVRLVWTLKMYLLAAPAQGFLSFVPTLP